MSCYGPLAQWYDQLTGDVPYADFADFYEAEFEKDGGQFALLLDLCHKVAHHAQTVRDGKWCECPDFCYWETPQMELAGKTLGIIGLGASLGSWRYSIIILGIMMVVLCGWAMVHVRNRCRLPQK